MFLIDRREIKQDNTAHNIGDPFSIYPYKSYMVTSRMDQFPKSQFSVRWAWVVSQIGNFQRGFLFKVYSRQLIQRRDCSPFGKQRQTKLKLEDAENLKFPHWFESPPVAGWGWGMQSWQPGSDAISGDSGVGSRAPRLYIPCSRTDTSTRPLHLHRILDSLGMVGIHFH